MTAASQEFRETVRHLRRDPRADKKWLLTEPHLLYLIRSQSEAYLKAMGNPEYASHFHSPTVEIIEREKERMFSDVGASISLVDLGPGYPDKTLPIAKSLKERGIGVTYFPVDISEEFLAVAAQTMRPWVNKVHACHCRFEELPARFPPDVYANEVCCFIGLTFMNFEPDIILAILRRIVAGKGRAVIATELITKSNTIDAILSGYKNDDVRNVAIGPLTNLGLKHKDLQYDLAFSDSRVEMGFTLLNDPVKELKDIGVAKTDRIVSAISYRYSEAALRKLLGGFFGESSLYFSNDGNTAVAMCR